MPVRRVNDGAPLRMRRCGDYPGSLSQFFKPVHFHLQPPDLAVQLVLRASLVDGFGATLDVEQRARVLQDFPLSLPNQLRMHFVFLGDFRNRLHAPHRFQSHLGLELRRMHPAFLPSAICYLPIEDDSLNHRLKRVVHYKGPQWIGCCRTLSHSII
jgi:hypothetical protein